MKSDDASPASRRAAQRSAANERMQLYRARRRDGFRCIQVEIGGADIRGLIQLGYLDRLKQDDVVAVRDALHRWFDAAFCEVNAGPEGVPANDELTSAGKTAWHKPS